MAARRRFRSCSRAASKGGAPGTRSVADALEVARAVEASPGLALRGVEGFEGVFGRDPADGKTAEKVKAFLEFLVDIAKAALAAENLFAPGPIVLSAGGSAHFDQVTKSLQGRRSRPRYRSRNPPQRLLFQP